MMIWFIAGLHALIGSYMLLFAGSQVKENCAGHAVAALVWSALSFATVYALVMP